MVVVLRDEQPFQDESTPKSRVGKVVAAKAIFNAVSCNSEVG
jgi:hypothetical protein